MKCPDCGNEMERKGNVHEGNDTGAYGREDLYQCPKCKNVEIK